MKLDTGHCRAEHHGGPQSTRHFTEIRMSSRQVQNLFADLPNSLPEELVDVLAQTERVRVERIVSTGQASPVGFWYDQPQHEWVVVLRGEAKLLLESERAPRHLKAGDHVVIPARCKHRVEWTSPTEPTVWLAVFFEGELS
jgi:cupin 2 domain-containing protein